MRAVAERFIRGCAAAAKRNARLINCNPVPLGVEKVNGTFNDVGAVFGWTNSYICHESLPQILLCETVLRILTSRKSFKFQVSSFEFSAASSNSGVLATKVNSKLET
jgi:hypothetical protein